MGKIVRFETFQASKNDALRDKARRRPVQLGFKRAPSTHTRSRRASIGWDLSGTTIFNIGIVAFAAFWSLFGYLSPSVVPLNEQTAPRAAPFVAPLTLPSATISGDAEQANFSFCHLGGGTNCVVDGDTIWYQGNNIRIADIDTPETHPPRCDREAELGTAATHKLHALLNSGAFSIETIDRDTDRYGRKLRILTRGGESIGNILVNDGLARWYDGGRRSWC